MAGRKYGVVVQAKVGGSYHALPKAEQEIPGHVFEDLMAKYAGKVELVRRYWTGAFNADVTDVLLFECSDPGDFHEFHQELISRFAENGDPNRFGEDVEITLGINPDAD